MIPTTVIGSFPVRLPGGRYAKAYFDGAGSDAPAQALRQAVDAQLAAGIDIVADGQTRGDFVSVFARNFRGALIQGRPVVVGELEYARLTSVDDALAARRITPKGKKLKGIITGPYTLARSSENRHYKSLKDLAFAYAEGLAREAAELSRVVDFVQVDEPFFSVDYPEYGRELTEKVLSNVKVPRMLHVCGDVSQIFGALAEYKVDYLEHEFAANPGLWEAVAGVDFKQTLGVGVVRSDDTKVETVGEILARMKTALGYVDAGRLMFNPDCGLRNHEPDSAGRKLANMVAARDLLRL
jgi:5-methyltetrahydropteroyltriglutamate--homocysteine methyltransferase